VPPREPTAPEMTPDQEEKVIKRVLAVLSPGMTKGHAMKLFAQFSKDGKHMTQQEFGSALKHLEGLWGLHPQDGVLILEVLKRWRFRANAESGLRGLPLWPLSCEDFVRAYPNLLRAVRDKYTPIGGRVHRSLFIRQSVGRIEDKYEIGARLGRGRYGEVFLVTTQSTRERRVCKRVRHQQQRVPTEELVDEVGLLRGLDHPHICKIFEYFESDEYVEMIMEPAFGGTLAQLVNGLYRNDAGEHFGQRPMELTEAWVATMLAQLLGALTYAHEVVGVIHKDLKSENILLVGKSGLKAVEVLEQPVHAMLADFGIAEVFVPESVVIMGTNSESLDVQRCSSRAMALEIGKPFEWKIQCSRAGGTPPYMSPEVFRGSFTEKCDIWSLGVVVFHVMTGELPYRGENLLHQIHIVSDPRQHPRWELLSLYRWSLGARLFCQHLLSKDEGMRPSASEAAKDDWLLRTKKMPDQQPSPEPCEIIALQHQHLQSHLMHMARHCIASQLSLPPLHHLYRRFQKYDTEGDGMLSYLEMRQALEDVGINSPEDMELIIESLDSNRNGTIEYSEFLAGCLDLASDEMRQHLRSVFDVFDLDGSGAISLEELRQVLTQGANPESSVMSSKVGYRHVPRMLPDGKTIEEVMKYLDTNGTGQVEYDELEKFLLAEHVELKARSRHQTV